MTESENSGKGFANSVDQEIDKMLQVKHKGEELNT